MNITLVTVGKLKEKYLKQAIDEYSKRLSRYCKLDIIELPDEKTPDNSYVVAMDLKGKQLTSEELSSFVERCGVTGNSNIVFVIGGSLGLSDEVIKRADYKLCFSKMTFPHQLFRVMLLEQVYRAFRIMKNEPYHK